MKINLLSCFLFIAGLHWITLKDSNQLHRLYVNHYGNVIGGYYLPLKPSWQDKETPIPYIAQCDEGKPQEFSSEGAAKAYVLMFP